MQTSIDDGLARSIAGLISVGLTPGDEQLERALIALQAIALMVVNADRDNTVVAEILNVPKSGRITRNEDGSISVTVLTADE